MILLEILIFAGHAVGITEDVCQKSGNDFRIRSLHVFGKRSDEHLESVPSEKESESENLATLSQHVHSTSLR